MLLVQKQMIMGYTALGRNLYIILVFCLERLLNHFAHLNSNVPSLAAFFTFTLLFVCGLADETDTQTQRGVPIRRTY